MSLTTQESAIQLLRQLRTAPAGWRIVASSELSEAQISQARACGRFHVDDAGFGFALAPPKKAMQLAQDDDSHWYLIPVELVAEFFAWCEQEHKDELVTRDFNEMRVDGPHVVTFENPKIDTGE